MSTIIITEDQAEIIGWALMMMRLEQLDKAGGIRRDYPSPRSKATQDRIKGYHERAARLEDAYSLLPPQAPS